MSDDLKLRLDNVEADTKQVREVLAGLDRRNEMDQAKQLAEDVKVPRYPDEGTAGPAPTTSEPYGPKDTPAGTATENSASPIPDLGSSISTIYQISVMECSLGGYLVTVDGQVAAFSFLEQAQAFINADMLRTFKKEDTKVNPNPIMGQPKPPAQPHSQPFEPSRQNYSASPISHGLPPPLPGVGMPRVATQSYNPRLMFEHRRITDRVSEIVREAPVAFFGTMLGVIGTCFGFLLGVRIA